MERTSPAFEPKGVSKLCAPNSLINKSPSTLRGETDGAEAGADEKKQTNEFI